MEGNNNSCVLYPIPTTLLKSSLDCYRSSQISTSQYHHQNSKLPVLHLLKGPSLEPDELCNYRLVSNLPYLHWESGGKTAKRSHENTQLEPTNTVSIQGEPQYGDSNCQDSERHAGIADKGHCVLLVMLYLSAAFDTVDQELLLHTLKLVSASDLRLKNGSNPISTMQVVRIKGVNSDPRGLGTGFPQGSLIGPFSFPLYTSPLFKIADNHQCNIHMYGDDMQIYMPFKLEESEDTRSKMEVCIEDVGWRIIAWNLMIIRQSFLSSASSPCRRK